MPSRTQLPFHFPWFTRSRRESIASKSRFLFPWFRRSQQEPVLSKSHSIYLILASLLLLVLVLGAARYGVYRRYGVHVPSIDTFVLTYKGDTFRTGQDLTEIILNTKNVNASQFGKQVSYPVDGRVYAQPLFFPHLNIGGVAHNVVFVATEHDSVYAFDADAAYSASPLWQTSLISPPAVMPVSGNDVYCPNIGGPDVGITGTPVIDAKTHTLYVVAMAKEHKQAFFQLHALDIATGKEKPGSPVTITASVPGTGESSSKGRVIFNPVRENQRAGLLLSHGVVYIAWGSHCDIPPYHGWVMGYNASTLRQVSVYVTTPDGGGAGVWQSGAGLAADQEGNIYLLTGEGSFDLYAGGRDAGNSVLKLSPQDGLHVVDTFTPFNWQCLNWYNMDLGSAGPLLLPKTNELIAVGKEGRIYVLDRSGLGGYNAFAGACDGLSLTTVDQVAQELPPNTARGGVWGSLAYWDGPGGPYVYVSGMLDNSIKAFRLTNGQLSNHPSSQSPHEKDEKGHLVYISGNPVVSSNGSRPGTGILWIIDRYGSLRAYDAANLAHELYSSSLNSTRDGLGDPIKFSVPTVANGKVFVGTQDSLVIYSLLY